MTPLKSSATLTAIALLAGIAASPADGTLLVEDSYNIGNGPGEYNAGDPLNGQPGNTPTTGGWDGAWTSGNNATSQEGGLEYTGIPDVTIGGTSGSQGHINSGGQAANRDIAANATLGNANELWMRILWQPDSTLGPEFFNFRRDGTADGRIAIARTDSLGDSSNRNQISVDEIATGNQISANADPFPTLSGGDTHLLLFRLTLDRAAGMDDTVDLWANPIATSPGALGTPTASVTANFLDGSDQLSQFDFTGSSTYLLDEFAIGASFFDVTGVLVPEPMSISLLVLAAVGLIGWRLRRQSPNLAE